MAKVERRQTQQINRAARSVLPRILTGDEVLDANTGIFLPRAKYLASVSDRERLLTQTRDMANKLEAMGYSAIVPSKLVMVTDVTREVIPVEAWRNINVLPLVAQKNRREMLRDIDYFFHVRGKEYWRYAVVTFGDRLPAFADLRGAVQAAKRKLRKWRFEASRDFGVTFGFVGLEFPRCEDGTYHIHANVLYKTPLFLDRGDAWRAFTHQFFGSWWHDAGRIQNVRELVKYPFKPNDVKGCEGEELVWLADSLFNLRIMELLGPINELRRERRDRGLKVTSVRGTPVWRKVDPIMRDKKPEPELMYDEDGVIVEAPPPQPREGFNIIVSRVMPSFLRTPWAEGATLIYNYVANPISEKAQDRLKYVQEYQQRAREVWDAKGCPDPQTAKAFADAVRTADNVVALSRERQKKRENHGGGEAPYMVHNETISVPEHFGDLVETWEGTGENVVEMWSEPCISGPPEPDRPPRYLDIFRKPTQNT